MESKTITLRDVAKAAGCSHTTVSLALRNHHRIPEQTRLKVRAVAEQLGYQINPYVQALLSQVRRGKVMTQRAGLAFVSNYSSKELWRKMPNNKLAVLGAFRRAEELGYHMEEFSLSDESMSLECLRKILLARGIRGILVAPTENQRMDLEMDVSPFALVSMGQSLRNRHISMVSHYHAKSMRTTLKELLKRGYKRIGFSVDPIMDERIEHGWTAHFYEYQMSIPKSRRIPLNRRSVGTTPEEILDWMDRYKPDVLISDMEEHVDVQEKAGWRVPEAIGYACLCITPGRSDVSGIQQNNQYAGIRSVELLVQLIQNGTFGSPESAQYVHIPGEWIEGRTLRPLA